MERRWHMLFLFFFFLLVWEKIRQQAAQKIIHKFIFLALQYKSPFKEAYPITAACPTVIWPFGPACNFSYFIYYIFYPSFLPTVLMQWEGRTQCWQ